MILVRADLSSGAYYRAWCAAGALYVPNKRLQFVNGHAGKSGSVTFSTLLLAFGDVAVDGR